MPAALGVPDTMAEALSPDWVTAALQPRFPGIEVVGVTIGPLVERVSTNQRFVIECAGGVPDGLSPNLCLKGYFNEAGRAARAVGEAEATFYRDLAGPSGVRTLRSVYADFDPATLHGVVITEDVVAEGADFLDGNSPYSPEQAADSLGQFAKLHSAFWNRAQTVGQPWLDPRLSAMVASEHEARMVGQISANFAGPLGIGVPEEVRDPQRLFDAYRALLEHDTTVPSRCVVHGDAHVGNLFLDAAGRPSLLDWQLVHRGGWYTDVGYHIASTLTVADRRRTERELLQHYLDELRAGGVEPPAWDDAWRDLSRGIVHGFFLWGITAYVEPSVIAVLLERLGTAAADHQAYTTVL